MRFYTHHSVFGNSAVYRCERWMGFEFWASRLLYGSGCITEKSWLVILSYSNKLSNLMALNSSSLCNTVIHNCDTHWFYGNKNRWKRSKASFKLFQFMVFKPVFFIYQPIHYGQFCNFLSKKSANNVCFIVCNSTD